MTCRHAAGDPNCGSTLRSINWQREEDERKKREEEKAEIYARTPDSGKYEIIEVERIGPHLVMKVLYPNCSKCAYEGRKVMVFLNVTEGEALRWRRIDPHFRDPANACRVTDAPPPAARFPASSIGWADALAYARGKGP